MDKQFTAREAREESAKVFGDHSVSGLETRARRRAMLRAFADLLEAQEKAVPVAWDVLNSDGSLHAGRVSKEHAEELISDHHNDAVSMRSLYTHPAPANSERLVGVTDEHDRIEFALRDAGFDLDRASYIATLATNSAGAERLAEALLWIMRAAYTAKEPCGNDPESPAAIRNGVLASIGSVAAQGLGIVQGPSLAAHSAPAQPPAASVSDAMVDRALHARVPGGAQVWHWLDEGRRPHSTAYTVMRAALEAALAAQENSQ